MAKPVQVDVDDRDVGAEPHRRLGGVEPHGAGADDDHVASGDAGNAGQEDPTASVGPAEVVGALLDGQPSGHLAHRREERQAAVGALDGLVADGDDVRLRELASEIRRGRQVQIREDELAGAEPRVLGWQRLLHLEDQLGFGPDALRRLQRGAGGGVLLVADPAAEPGSPLDEQAVPALAERSGPGRREGDPLLSGLDLSRHTDDHRPLTGIGYVRLLACAFPSRTDRGFRAQARSFPRGHALIT